MLDKQEVHSYEINALSPFVRRKGEGGDKNFFLRKKKPLSQVGPIIHVSCDRCGHAAGKSLFM